MPSLQVRPLLILLLSPLLSACPMPPASCPLPPAFFHSSLLPPVNLLDLLLSVGEEGLAGHDAGVVKQESYLGEIGGGEGRDKSGKDQSALC